MYPLAVLILGLGAMMARTGKTGADAISVALKHICRVITRFRVKLDAVIDAAAGAGVITTMQAEVAHDWIAGAEAVCVIFELVAKYSGFTP